MNEERVNKFAKKIAKVLKVEPSDIISTTGNSQYISISKIADILEARGQYSFIDNVCLADCLQKHYKRVNYLLDSYWRHI